MGVLLSAATTVFATLLIALRIILVTRESRCFYSYTKVIEILVESAAVQSAVLLVAGVINVMVAERPTDVGVLLVAYTSVFRRTIVVMISLYLSDNITPTDAKTQGIAPTLIAFRVADEKTHTENNSATRTSPLMHITFKRSTYGADTNSVAQRTWMSTVHFDRTHREDDDASIHSDMTLEGTKKATHVTGLDEV